LSCIHGPVRQQEPGRIEEIEKLGPEFERDSFGERERLRYRNIEIDEFWSAKDISAGVAKMVRICAAGSLYYESRFVEPSLNALLVIREFTAADPVRPDCSAWAGIDSRIREVGSERISALQCRDSADLPAAQE
jgi:hypothetical protein